MGDATFLLMASLDQDEFLRRCTALATELAARAEEGEELRGLPEATMHDARDGRLLEAVVPASLGGHGLGVEALAQGTRILGHGCPASAWTLSFLMLHGWLLSKFPAAGRAELFSSDEPDGVLSVAHRRLLLRQSFYEPGVSPFFREHREFGGRDWRGSVPRVLNRAFARTHAHRPRAGRETLRNVEN